MAIYEVILRLFLAIMVGGLIGYEREFKNRPAGFRTHILVCLGATIISMIQRYSIDEVIGLVTQYPELASGLKADFGRLGAQVISGVGFLGAGTIIQDKGCVKGLTTAASLWVVACIGLAVGYGYYFLSIVSALSVFLVLVSLKRFENSLLGFNSIKLQVEYKDEDYSIEKMEEFFKQRRINIKEIQYLYDKEKKCNTNIYVLSVPWFINGKRLVNDINYNANFTEISCARLI